MKKISTLVLSISLLSSSILYAGGSNNHEHGKSSNQMSSNDHTGMHMHDGKMMDHSEMMNHPNEMN